MQIFELQYNHGTINIDRFSKANHKRQLLTAYVVFNWFGDYIITHYVVSVNVIVLHLEIFSKCFEILLERSFCNDIS